LIALGNHNRGTKRGWRGKHNADWESESIQSETKDQSNLGDKDTLSKISYNDFDRNDNILDPPIDKAKSTKLGFPPKMINNDD